MFQAHLYIASFDTVPAAVELAVVGVESALERHM